MMAFESAYFSSAALQKYDTELNKETTIRSTKNVITKAIKKTVFLNIHTTVTIKFLH